MSEIKLTADSGGGTTSLKAPSTTTSNADVVLKLPVADGSSGQVLKTDGSGQLSFTSNAGTTINNNADNRVITGSGTANTLNGEANCTFNGDSLGLNSSSTSEINLQTSNNTRFKIQAGSNFAQFLTQNNVPLAFKTDAGTSGGTERMRIDTSGRVQIGGVTGPNNAKLFVAGTNSTNYMTFRNTSAGDGSGARWNNIRFQGTQSGGEVSDLVHLQANHDGTADDEKGAFEVLINDGNDGDSLNKRIRVDSDGLKFNSDTAAANALDDYEEGTWTPTNTIGLTLTNNNPAYYLKIGSLVMVQFDISFSGASDSSQCGIIQSLPFTSENTTNHFSQGSLPHISNNNNFKLDTSLDHLLLFIAPNESRIDVFSFNTSTFALRSHLVGRRIRHTMFYKAA